MVELIGLAFSIYAVFTWAIASLVYKAGLEKTEPKANLFFRLCCVSFGTLIFSLIFGNYMFFSILNDSELIFYLILCLISGLSVTVGDLLYYISLKKIDASRAYPLVQLSLIFIFPFSILLFGEEFKLSVLLGGALFLFSVFILSSKDKNTNFNENGELEKKNSESVIIGVLFAVGAAFLWAVSILSFNQARIITGDVFITNFFRVAMAMVLFLAIGIFRPIYYSGFKKENRGNLKYFIYIGIAGILSLGFADTLFYKAAEINGLVLTSTFTVNTPMVQQIFSILILKEKFRKKFLIAVALIILGNYIILFL
ncbi:MAG: DMT family transporter [Candidatus Lokiarchaeota archaeon]|nr:DMT family transporter [Candidatus Lokiarchaeota archaeon]